MLFHLPNWMTVCEKLWNDLLYCLFFVLGKRNWSEKFGIQNSYINSQFPWYKSFTPFDPLLFFIFYFYFYFFFAFQGINNNNNNNSNTFQGINNNNNSNIVTFSKKKQNEIFFFTFMLELLNDNCLNLFSKLEEFSFSIWFLFWSNLADGTTLFTFMEEVVGFGVW